MKKLDVLHMRTWLKTAKTEYFYVQTQKKASKDEVCRD